MLARAIQQAMGGDIYPPNLAQYGRAIVFDPQDLKTLFQDAAGTIQVTGVEQPVGKMIDKGGGNYHATQSTAGSRPTLSARYNMLVGTDTLATQSVTTLATDYTLSFGGTGTVTLSGTATGTLSAGVSIFAATAGTLTLTVSGNVTNAQLVATNLSHPQGLTYGQELVTNGTFDSDLSGWAVTGNGWSWNGGAARLVSASSSDTISQNVIPDGKTVLISFSATRISGNIRFSIPSANLNLILTTSGEYRYIFTNTSSSTQLFMFVRSSTCDWSIDNVSVREITNINDVRLPYQSVTNSTTYDSDPSKFPWYLHFTDHWMVTPSIDATAYDKVTVACGLRKMSDASRGTVIESSATIASNNGSFALTAPQSAAATIGMESKGTALTDAIAPALSAPITRSVVALASISADSNVIRVNGAAADTDSGDQGTGNFGNYPIYIGKRAGTSLPFNGNFYGATILFPTALPNDNIVRALERHYAAKAGIKL